MSKVLSALHRDAIPPPAILSRLPAQCIQMVQRSVICTACRTTVLDAEVWKRRGVGGMMRVGGRDIVSSDAYATGADFQRIFTENMSSLYLLSFLLTADGDKAEESFVAGINESNQANRVFKEWALSWARRTIIQNAIRLIGPRQQSQSATRNPIATRFLNRVPLVLQAEVSAILELPPFERFVFIMSTLERYSDQDCSILLSCTRKDVGEARTRALQELGRLMKLQRNATDAGPHNLAVRENFATVVELRIAQYFGLPASRNNFSRGVPLSP